MKIKKITLEMEDGSIQEINMNDHTIIGFINGFGTVIEDNGVVKRPNGNNILYFISGRAAAVNEINSTIRDVIEKEVNN